MPEWGARFVNDSGIVQIDGNYRNYQLIAKGSDIPDTVDPGNGGDYRQAYKSLQFSGLNNPIMAIRCPDMAYVNQGGNSSAYSFRLYRRKDAASAIDWWLFDNVKPAPPTGWGMVIRNQFNEVVFSTAAAPFRVAGLITHDAQTSASQDFIFVPGRSYAFTPCRMAEMADVQLGPGGGGTVPTAAILDEVSTGQTIPGGVRIGKYPYFVFIGDADKIPPGISPSGWFSYLSTWLILDVTNI